MQPRTKLEVGTTLIYYVILLTRTDGWRGFPILPLHSNRSKIRVNEIYKSLHCLFVYILFKLCLMCYNQQRIQIAFLNKSYLSLFFSSMASLLPTYINYENIYKWTTAGLKVSSNVVWKTLPTQPFPFEGKPTEQTSAQRRSCWTAPRVLPRYLRKNYRNLKAARNITVLFGLYKALLIRIL